MMLKRFFLGLLCLALPIAADAQSGIDTTADRDGSGGMELWAGFSNRSPKWGVLGNRPGMSFGLAAARFTRRIKTTSRYALDYTFDVVPVAISSPPIQFEDDDDTGTYLAADGEDCSVIGCRFPQGSAYGAGASPLGVTAVYRRESAVQPRFGFAGGFLVFDRAVPTVVSTRFNFTASIEAGVQLLSRKGDGVLLVYRFHHLSNAGIGYDNSALASHVISIGGRWRARTP